MAYGSKGVSTSRFSLLLLDEGEYYFDDFSAFYYPSSQDRDLDDSATWAARRKGRIRLCSASLLFEPDDVCEPILRLPFGSVTQFGRWNGGLYSTLSSRADIFAVVSTLTCRMKANNLNVPYEFVASRQEHRFSLNFESLQNFLPRVQELHHIHTEFARDPAARDAQLARIIDNKERRIAFDPSWLVNLSESIAHECRAVRVTPLVANPGRFVVTDAYVYFQPYNNINPVPVEKFPLDCLQRVAKRRHILRHVGLEFFFVDGSSYFFAYPSAAVRDRLYDLVLAQPGCLRLQTNDQTNVTYAWQQGSLSNFDYLMYLNNLAGRTFNDITQYPVFPWVLADYTSDSLDLSDPASFRDLSKPVGALNPVRLANLKARYAQIPDDQPKFLYGTHYSNAAYVLSYLVRSAPEYMLRLQNGKFDSPDRLFHSIAETFSAVMTSPSDVRELIPEFFSSADFLRNAEDLPLGVKQNRVPLGDVVLPPWAHGSPDDFIRLHRDALESEYVSQNIHHWIDLIFGYKQQGRAAFDADNLFYPYTYEGAIDIEKIADPQERRAREAWISEFGQTPRQIFDGPHPPRLDARLRSHDPIRSPSATLLPSLRRTGSNHIVAMSPALRSSDSLIDSPSSPASSLSSSSSSLPSFSSSSSSSSSSSLSSSSSSSSSSVASSSTPNDTAPLSWCSAVSSGLTLAFETRLHREEVHAIELSADGSTVFSGGRDSALKIFSIAERRQLRSLNIGDLALGCLKVTADAKLVHIGSWDNNVYTYSVEFGRVVDTLRAHDDAVAAIDFNEAQLLSGSWDSTVKIWQRRPAGLSRTPLVEFVDNETEVKSVRLSPDGRLAVSGAADGVVHVFDVRSRNSVQSIEAHQDCVHQVAFTADSKRIVSCSDDGTVKLTQISGAQIASFDLAAGPVWSFVADPPGNVVVVGADDGSLSVYNFSQNKRLHSTQTNSPVRCLAANADASLIVAGANDAYIRLFEAKEN